VHHNLNTPQQEAMKSSSSIALIGIYLRIRGAWKTLCFNPRPPFSPPVADLLADPSSVGRRHPRRNHPCFPRNHLPDSPLASLYRLYEFYVIDDTIAFRNEIEWFWYRHQWLVHAIPDPEDPDPLRYAILAGLTEILCLSFNRLIRRGLPRNAPPIIGNFEVLAAQPRVIETRPEWALNIVPLTEKVFVPNNEGQNVAEEEASAIFSKLGVYIEQPHCFFV
jgi:hypothetical protein